jgi:hypothetical protein
MSTGEEIATLPESFRKAVGFIEAIPVIGFAFDSITLREMPAWHIKDCEQKGLDWSMIYLSPDEVEPAKPRDSERDVRRVKRRLAAQVGWLGIGPEGERIQAVVNLAKSTREWDIMLAWEKYLKQNLQFPFEAVVDEFQEYGPLRAGDRLTVLGIVDTDDLYGVIVACHKGRQHLDFSLADLAAVDEASPNAQPIDDYRVWFANR